MEEDGTDSYYLQDDLGSPMQLMDEEGKVRETYGFDEFGRNLDHHPEKQLQPFGYTGYHTEEAGGLYFAQARRYDADNGRFISEDFVKGFIDFPFSFNHYVYCWNRPLDFVDGAWPQWMEDIGTWCEDWWKNSVVGEDLVVYQVDAEVGKFELVEHHGGNIIVLKKLAIDPNGAGKTLNPTIGWSVTASWNIPYTDISHRQSISGETLDIRTWKVNDIFRGTDPETNTYFESGYSIDENGIGGRQGIGGASDSIPFTLPNGIDTNLYSNLSWSITAEPARITWDKVVELALCAVFVTAGVLAIVGLTADDATGLGVADDSFLIPVTKFVTDKINAICEIKNIKNVRSRYRV